ncbi:unnamed protein product [Microthlaspi erraticum]|nr:unnamed protein product [Microthlaspi erraticum]
MFHTAKWTAGHSPEDCQAVTMQLWAHLTEVPLDLRHQNGLSLIAGLIGEPKETDDFTKNLVSLTIAHVKVEVRLTKDLPDVVEFERESGEVVEVFVDYPWLPPKCSHCQELGHIAKNCLLLPIPTKEVPPAPEKGKQEKIYKKKESTSKEKDPISSHPKSKPTSPPETPKIQIPVTLRPPLVNHPTEIIHPQNPSATPKTDPKLSSKTTFSPPQSL